jgi:hypothetical protein
MLIVAITLQLAIGKECLFEGSTLEARRQARLLIVNHIVIHTDGIVFIHVTLFHHFIRAAQDFDNATAVPALFHTRNMIEKV